MDGQVDQPGKGVAGAEKHVWLIGNASRVEFQAPVSWLADDAGMTRFSTSEAALQQPDSDFVSVPDAIVFVQSWPGEWHECDVEALHIRWPLAHLMMLLGSWSEGESRSGRPCRGTWRMYWYDFSRRLALRSREGTWVPAPSWNLPRTATDIERLACDLEGRLGADGCVVIRAQSRDAYESLSDGCRAAGYATFWQRADTAFRVDGAAAGIWDSGAEDDGEWRWIGEFARQLEPHGLIVVVGFPRAEDWSRAADVGGRVLAKPFQLPDLWHLLQKATG